MKVDERSIRIISSAQAADVADKVNSLKHLWVRRSELKLHTLGAAAYLDAPTAETRQQFEIEDYDSERYQAGVKRFNPLLWSNFEWLYHCLRDTLEDFLGGDCIFLAEKALPGFHVFEHHEYLSNWRNQIPHFDRQYECLHWPFQMSTFSTEHISFTLPVKLPRTGGGLLLWETELRDMLCNDKQIAKRIAKQASREEISYEVGKLFIHSGHRLHQISPWKSNPGDQRITMQGHALFHEGEWIVYW